MAAKNATVGGDMNFRFRMLLKGTVRPLDLDVQPLSCILLPRSSAVSPVCALFTNTKLAFPRNALLSVPSGNSRFENPPCLENSS